MTITSAILTGIFLLSVSLCIVFANGFKKYAKKKQEEAEEELNSSDSKNQKEE